jgi:hypothetical protein
MKYRTSNMREVSGKEQIEGIKNLSKALRDIPDVVIDVTEYSNGTRVINNVTNIHHAELSC